MVGCKEVGGGEGRGGEGRGGEGRGEGGGMGEGQPGKGHDLPGSRYRYVYQHRLNIPPRVCILLVFFRSF